MAHKFHQSFEQIRIFKSLVRWTVILLPVSVSIGSVVAFFLWLLNAATHFRFQYPWLLYFLPLIGLLIHFIYKFCGKTSEKGNNLILEEVHTPGEGIPKRMAPIVLASTVLTHLFGGSAGREGTAVQIGGSLAQMFSKWFKLNAQETSILLTAGIAAGFGAVFGTPLTGAIFALEVLAIGRIQYYAVFPCLVASLVGDLTVSAWQIHHTTYRIDTLDIPNLFETYFSLNILLMVKVVVASIAFGLASLLFAQLIHRLRKFFLNFISHTWLIPIIGGIVIILLTVILGKPDYLGLGVDTIYPGATTIPSAFTAGGADTWSWLWKTIYTAFTLSTGFKGGEVTPLFYIGATFGNVLSILLNAPVSLFAALGFIAVFAGATNTPLACTIMGVELFGGEYLIYFAIACYTAYFFSGHCGIYSAQKTAIPKGKPYHREID
ncbi:voltage-gated chloride channel family protein [Olivibacter sp. SDN3]|uniref:voltage-gated chloride channel family protein n=1 Tax=Olivibacter sp. SDN3 TaxID=2764720 RepID=UPI0016516554|nr:voltage-gated chloride channel family protein [Olivibacter sp. SDN3]QNL50171.1 voltage-gated chloride channel family protein [Olivibacter sp. SDN3]